MKIESREGKYYLQLLDGEKEVDKEFFENYITLLKYIEIGSKYATNKKWSIEDLPKELNSVIKVDIFINDLMLFAEDKIKENNKDGSKKILLLIDALRNTTKELIANPIEKNNIEINNYLLVKLDSFYNYVERWIQNSSVKNKINDKEEKPVSFEELFFNPNDAQACLDILKELQPPVLDNSNNYIGKNKGIIPLWIRILITSKPRPLIKRFPDIVYKDLLNSKINGLNLSKDASEFRKQYSRINKIELDIKAILSQFSQSGRLGK